MYKTIQILLVSIAMLLLSTYAFAAGSEVIVDGSQGYAERVTVIEFTWTADDSNGSVPAAVATLNYGAYITRVVTDPGTTAPTDNYDITLTDVDSYDVMGGTLANRDTADTEQAIPAMASGIYGSPLVKGNLTLTITGNSVNSATGVVRVYCVRAY